MLSIIKVIFIIKFLKLLIYSMIFNLPVILNYMNSMIEKINISNEQLLILWQDLHLNDFLGNFKDYKNSDFLLKWSIKWNYFLRFILKQIEYLVRFVKLIPKSISHFLLSIHKCIDFCNKKCLVQWIT